MSTIRAGWRTTHEIQDEGWPIRYYHSEDDYHDIAFVDTQQTAQLAADCLNDMKARPGKYMHGD